MIILLLNIICAVVVAIINVQFLISFEVAFIGSALVVFSSYKAITNKINLASVESSEETLRQNAESFKDSNDSTKSSDKADCHDSATQNLAMTTKSNAIKSIISCNDDSMAIPQQNAESRKDKNGTISHNNTDSCKDERSIDCHESQGDSADSMAIPRKERIFLGFKLSFGILRLVSYAFVAVSVVVLINHKLFFIAPFFGGIALSSVTLALYASKKSILK